MQQILVPTHVPCTSHHSVCESVLVCHQLAVNHVQQLHIHDPYSIYPNQVPGLRFSDRVGYDTCEAFV